MAKLLEINCRDTQLSLLIIFIASTVCTAFKNKASAAQILNLLFKFL